MKRVSILIFFLLRSNFVDAQDSLQALKHEIGFNTVSLIKQIISNNPSSSLSQLPYDIFYNFYPNEQVGARVGLGIFVSNNSESILGQSNPRTTNTFALRARAGVSYNFVKYKRLTFNAFADAVTENITMKTVNTETTQTFGNPFETTTTTSSDKSDGIGGQIGVGVKYNLYKHLSLYTEVPFNLMIRHFSSDVKISGTGFIPASLNSTSKNTSAAIFLPTTIYLVLRF